MRKLKSVSRENNNDEGANNVLDYLRPMANRPNYFYNDNSSEIIRKNADGKIIQRFSPIPQVLLLEKCSDAPAGQQHIYTVQIGDDKKRISRAELFENGWTDYFSVLKGVADKKTRELYADAIHEIATREGTNKTFIRQRTGFHSINLEGKEIYGYLTPQYFITSKNNEWPEQIRFIESDGNYSNKAPEKIKTSEALKLIDELNLISPNGALLIGLLNNICALTLPLRKEIGHCLIIHGVPGSQKTSLAKLIKACAGFPYDFHSGTDASFRDTFTSIELKIDARPHVPFIIDDLKRNADEPANKIADKYRTLELIVGASYTHDTIRARSKKNLEAQRGFIVNTLPIITAEHLPLDAEDSLFRRVLLIRLERGELNLGEHSERIKNNLPLLQAAHFKIAELIISELNSGASILSDNLNKQAIKYRDLFRKALSKQLPEKEPDVRENIIHICADLMSAAWMLDRALGTKESFRSLAYTHLLTFLIQQIKFINERHGREAGESFINETLRQFAESLYHGLKIDNEFRGIITLADDSQSHAQGEARFGYRRDRMRVSEIGWLDRRENKLIVSNLMQKELARIYGELAHASVSVSDFYDILKNSDFLAEKAQGHSKRRMPYRARGCEKEIVWGWILFSDKFLRAVEYSDQ